MRDISARELKGHNILAVERFQDNTRRMIEFSVLRSCAYGSPGDEMRLFLTEDGYQAALVSQKRREIKIRRHARIIEGHILDLKEIREAIREDCRSQHDMETADIDRIFQTLPFSQRNSLLDKPPMPKRPYRRRKKEQKS